MTPPRQQAPPRRSRRSAYRASRRRPRAPIGAGERRQLVRNRLIESRLTPNRISLTGLTLKVPAEALVCEHRIFLGGFAVIIGSILVPPDARNSPITGLVTTFGTYP